MSSMSRPRSDTLIWHDLASSLPENEGKSLGQADISGKGADICGHTRAIFQLSVFVLIERLLGKCFFARTGQYRNKCPGKTYRNEHLVLIMLPRKPSPVVQRPAPESFGMALVRLFK